MDALISKKLTRELLNVYAHKLETWNSACKTMENMDLCLPTKYPCLLFAEDAGADLNSAKVTKAQLQEFNIMFDEDESDDNDGNNDKIKTEVDSIISSSARGLFSLATQKIYNVDLPEAMDRVVLGTSKGWLVTIGRDLRINLLHPLLRHQFPLPPMLTLPCQYEYDDDFQPEQVHRMFVFKVVMSTEVPPESQDTRNLPIIMAIYGEFRVLGFARLGDKLWKDVETSKRCFEDVVYYKERFYAIDCHGAVFMCDTCNDDHTERHKGTHVTSIPFERGIWDQSYLIESLSGSHIWVVLRFRKGEINEERPTPGKLWYYTSDFWVLKLEIQHIGSDNIPSYTWTENVKDLGNEALFIGRNSSVSVPSSEFIKPNSIYFTDDNGEVFRNLGGGHDIGIFNIKTGTIESHHQEVSVHPFSPAVWYI